MSTHAEDGCKFYRICTIGFSVKPGYFDALLEKTRAEQLLRYLFA